MGFWRNGAKSIIKPLSECIDFPAWLSAEVSKAASRKECSDEELIQRACRKLLDRLETEDVAIFPYVRSEFFQDKHAETRVNLTKIKMVAGLMEKDLKWEDTFEENDRRRDDAGLEHPELPHKRITMLTQKLQGISAKDIIINAVVSYLGMQRDMSLYLSQKRQSFDDQSYLDGDHGVVIPKGAEQILYAETIAAATRDLKPQEPADFCRPRPTGTPPPPLGGYGRK